MTLLFMEGFEDYSDDLETYYKWDDYVYDSNDPFVIYPNIGQYGGTCIGVAGLGSVLSKNVLNETDIIVGFAFNRVYGAQSNNYGIITFNSMNFEAGRLLLYASGKLYWEGYATLPDDGPSSNILKLNTWHYIEVRFKLHNTEGIVEVKVDGDQWLYITGDTVYSTDTCLRNVVFNGTSGGGYVYYDDIYILNTSGSVNNDFLGNVKVLPLKPDGAGNYAQFTPSSGANYACVDDADWSGSDYVETSSDGQTDTHTYEAVPSSGIGEIFGIQLVNGAKKIVESDGTELKHVVRNNSTDYVSSAVDMWDEVIGLLNIYETDPNDSNPWTKTKLDATEFGYQSVIP